MLHISLLLVTWVLRTNQHLWMLFQMKCWSWEVWCWATSSYICQVRSTCYCYLSCTCCTLWFCVRPFYRPLTNFHNRSSRKFDHLMLFESILQETWKSLMLDLYVHWLPCQVKLQSAFLRACVLLIGTQRPKLPPQEIQRAAAMQL